MRILADTSVWVDYLRHKNAPILDPLNLGDVVMHDYVIGEIVLGGISQTKLAMIDQLAAAATGALSPGSAIPAMPTSRR